MCTTIPTKGDEGTKKKFPFPRAPRAPPSLSLRRKSRKTILGRSQVARGNIEFCSPPPPPLSSPHITVL